MKKLFISCPMKGRKEEDIKESIEKMHKIAEIIFNEELEVIKSYKELEAIKSYIPDRAPKCKHDALDECFACEECNSDCEKCPLDRGVIGCNKSWRLYRIWLESEDADVRRALAKVIAGLPWKSAE